MRRQLLDEGRASSVLGGRHIDVRTIPTGESNTPGTRLCTRFRTARAPVQSYPCVYDELGAALCAGRFLAGFFGVESSWRLPPAFGARSLAVLVLFVVPRVLSDVRKCAVGRMRGWKWLGRFVSVRG